MSVAKFIDGFLGVTLFLCDGGDCHCGTNHHWICAGLNLGGLVHRLWHYVGDRLRSDRLLGVHDEHRTLVAPLVSGFKSRRGHSDYGGSNPNIVTRVLLVRPGWS